MYIDLESAKSIQSAFSNSIKYAANIPFDYKNTPLYHYTDIQGLYNIANSNATTINVERKRSERWKCLHASSIRHMNDSMEFEQGVNDLLYAYENYGPVKKRKYKRTIAGLYKEGVSKMNFDSTWDVTGLALKTIQDNVNVYKNTLFCFSMTSECNELSQWREYADHCRGVALRIDGSALKNQEHGWTIWPVIYNKRLKKQFAENALMHIVNLVYLAQRGLEEDTHDQEIRLERLADTIVVIIGPALCALKSQSFASEKEHRIVKCGIADKVLDLKYKVINGNLRTYVELVANDGVIPITGIVPGPCMTPENLQSLRLMLTDEDYKIDNKMIDIINVEKIPARY